MISKKFKTGTLVGYRDSNNPFRICIGVVLGQEEAEKAMKAAFRPKQFKKELTQKTDHVVWAAWAGDHYGDVVGYMREADVFELSVTAKPKREKKSH